MSKQVTLSEEQAKLVMQCLDLAVKTGGLNAAAQILPVAQHIDSQITKQPTQEETT
jgi:thiamine biosynthesis lipoprotein ApbE